MTSSASIILCPGQGAQRVGMGRAWAQRHRAAAAVFDEADKQLGMALSELCFAGPEQPLNRTDIAQAAIYTTSVACFRAMALPRPAATAGLSLGEFTALHLAGAFDFATGLELVRLRGRAMQDAAEATDGLMVALIGADEQKAAALCDAARGDDVLVPANYNAPGQIVISGSRAACDRAVALAEQFDLAAKPLAVAGAFHSPLMQPAADRLAEALDKVQWNRPEVPVVANVTARPHDPHDVASIKQRLIEQLTHPVRWAQSMRWLIDNVPGRYVELAPGKVLAGLMKRIDRKVKVHNHAEPD